jgi:protein TIF31
MFVHVLGILEKEQEQSVVYGSTDFGKTCTSNDKYRQLLEKVSTMLKIKPHSIKTDKGESIELLTAVECKGIVGNDGRHYLLDLLRMMPPDLNYLSGRNVPSKTRRSIARKTCSSRC